MSNLSISSSNSSYLATAATEANTETATTTSSSSSTSASGASLILEAPVSSSSTVSSTVKDVVVDHKKAGHLKPLSLDVSTDAKENGKKLIEKQNEERDLQQASASFKSNSGAFRV